MTLLAEATSTGLSWVSSNFSLELMAIIGLAATISIWLLRGHLTVRGIPVLLVRAIILLILSVACLGWIQQQHETEPPRLAIVVDLSASMASSARNSLPTRLSSPDLTSPRSSENPASLAWEETRMGDVLKHIRDQEAWLDNLEENRRIDWFSMGDRLQHHPEGKLLLSEAKQPRGETSRIVDGITELLQQVEGRRYAGIILVTDGVDTEGQSSPVLSESLRRIGIPFFPIRVGEAETRDRMTLDIEPHVTEALVGETLIVGTRLQSSDDRRETVTVELRDEATGETIAEQKWVRRETTSTRLVWEIPLRSPGLHRHSFHVVNDVGADLTQPRTTSIQAIRHRAKVLIIAADPSYEFRYLKHALQRSQVDAQTKELAFEVNSWLQTADLEYIATDPSAVARMPADSMTLAEFDVVILIDPMTWLEDPTRGMSSDELEALRDYVEQDGGNLFLVTGPRASSTPWINTPLAALLPSAPDQFLERRIDSNRGDFQELRPTEIGMSLAPLRGLNPAAVPQGTLTEATAEAPATPLQVSRILAPQSLRPTVRPLLVAASGDGASSEKPLVVSTWQPLGLGSVVFQGFDEAYRLRRRTSDERAARYWIQWVHHLARLRHLENQPATRLELDPESPRAGQSLRVLVTSGNPDSLPPQLILQSPDGNTQSLDLLDQESTLGRRFAETLLSQSGSHALRWNDRLSGELRELRFEVLPARSESDSQPADHALLELLAELSGGEVQSPEWFGNLPSRLSDRAIPTERLVSETPLWRLPQQLGWLGLSLIGLLVFEWWLRRH